MNLMVIRWKTVLKRIRRHLFEFLGSDFYSQPALNGLDKKLKKYLNYHNGFFIEVGANDGYNQSNTYYLEKIMGWRGVLVEAVPTYFRECKRERKNANVFNYALVASNTGESHVEIYDAGLMSLVNGALKDDDRQQKHLRDALTVQQLSTISTIDVPTRTLESILDELPQPITIDFFSLDVEGYEAQVLEGINLARYKPLYILVEANFIADINLLLEPGYEMIEQLTFHDYLFKRKTDR